MRLKEASCRLVCVEDSSSTSNEACGEPEQCPIGVDAPASCIDAGSSKGGN
jgi:hypothetical protein